MGLPDVDLDVVDRDRVMSILSDAVPASQLSADGKRLVRHNTGVYFQNIPTDPLNGLATFPYEIAEDLGYYKVDFIPYHAYEGVRDEAHLRQLLEMAESERFPWKWFEQSRFFTNPNHSLRVTHLGNHYELTLRYPPRSVLDVAALIALIRPRKSYLIGRPWAEICDLIWQKLPEEENGEARNYFFKKSHAVAFALVILVHMQMLDGKV